MDDTEKYLIHAEVTADGVVERSDVVGAIFGQTEGLLGDELDLRALRRSGKVSRIDAAVTTGRGQSRGTLTIATSLDKVETATLAAALETITRVGPCRAELSVTEIEDVRAATRRDVVDRAKELLRTGFDETIMSSEEILSEVREYVRVADVTEFQGLPAGPRVVDSDAIIVVEGRSDVLTLLKYGIKNAVAVEGTNVPDAIAELTEHRTVTAFLDGDRGGDLIWEELTQVADVDYVTFAPAGKSVEDLDHQEVFDALRNKVPVEEVADASAPREVIAATDGSATPAPPPDSDTDTTGPETETGAGTDLESSTDTVDSTTESSSADDVSTDATIDTIDTGSAVGEATPGETGSASVESTSIYAHATDVIREGSGHVRLLDADRSTLAEGPAAETTALLEAAAEPPDVVILDDVLTQRTLDIAADEGVSRIVARELGQFTKRPTGVQVHAVDDVAQREPV